MRIWNAIRRFSGIGKRVRADHSVRRASKRQNPNLRSLINRGLRMEQFEERMLLSITPSNLSELWDVNSELARSLENAMDLSGYSEEELTSATQWVVGLSDSSESSPFHAMAANADYLGKTSYLPNAAIWEFDTSLDWTTVVDTLDCDAKVEYFYPLVSQSFVTMSVPNDPLFPDQWHLDNTGQNGGTPGMDVNILTAWDSVLGTDVVIGIADSNLQYDHPDLSTNYRADLSHDFGDGDDDPYPKPGDSPHGTSVAGVAAGTGDNDIGITGAAPDADLAGMRLDFSVGWSDYLLSTIFGHENQSIDIYNNSWGPNWDYGIYLSELGPLSQAALQDGATNGRGGLGNIYVFAAGNDRDWVAGDTNYCNFANSRYTIAVAALDHNGHYSSYSNTGTSLLVSAYSNSVYSGITTTDLLGEEGYNSSGSADGDSLADIDYTSTFGGTSSATPLVSGVIALMLEANPNLTYRDVEHILAETSTQNDSTNPSWHTNGAGYHVSRDYGFGAINAGAAVAMAYDWENVDPEQNATSGLVSVNEAIPEMGYGEVVQTITMDDSIKNIEWVELTVDIDHTWVGDLQISLVSPDGTESLLVDENINLSDPNYNNWTFTSCHHWGESSEGEWTIVVRDNIDIDVGVWNNFELKIYGTNEEVIPDIPVQSAGGLELIDVIPNSGDPITENSTQHVAPRELTLIFNDEQQIDPETIGAISMKRSGGDDIFLNLNDENVEFGYIAIGDRPNEIVIRFAETLPDDMYELTLIGKGDAPLATLGGAVFHGSENLTITFNLDLGAQVTAIVPQPITREANGILSQSRNTIEVYFNPDTLDKASVETETFYRLSITPDSETATTVPDVNPSSVTYDPQNNKAILTFDQDLEDYGTGVFRLRIGNESKEIVTGSMDAEGVADIIDSATEIIGLGGAGNAQSITISSKIEPQPYDIVFPGGIDDPGHRDLPSDFNGDEHIGNPDGSYGTTTRYYNFNYILNYDLDGEPYYNYISDKQKDLARQIFELYSTYLGIDFIEDTSETNPRGFIVGTGNLKAVNPENLDIVSKEGGYRGLAGGGRAILDIYEDWGPSEYNGPWFNTAMHEIGHLLGLKHTYDLPGYAIMGSSDSEYYAVTAESMYPGLAEILHGQYKHRPDSIDVDMYSFTLEAAGTLSAEIIAERLNDSSLLDSVISIYDADHHLIARNDDYYSEDSYVELDLDAGTYYVAITSTGNTEFDPDVSNSGLGGTSQGEYDLKLDFMPKATSHLIDATGTELDGDMDGIPGGVHNFWFDVQTEANTVFVDKLASEDMQNGSLAHPYSNIIDAINDINEERADEDDDVGDLSKIIRIVGNRSQSFDTQVVKSTFDNPTDVAVGDFNNDGFADLVSIAQNGSNYYAQIHFGIDGETYMSSTVNCLVGQDPTDLKVADLNNDGAVDIIVTNSGSDTISLLLNNGDGSFASHVTRFTGDLPVAVETGDLNQDGRLDLVVANQADNTVGILLSSEVSFFADQVAYNTGDLPSDVLVGDVNNDGLLDVVSINQSSVTVLLNTGSGIFASPITFSIGSNLVAGTLGDFGEDPADDDDAGTYDLALIDADTNTLYVMLGNGDGTFDTPQEFSSIGQHDAYGAVPAYDGTPTDIGVGDADGDGYLDLFVSNKGDASGTDKVAVLFGTGTSALFAEQKVFEVGNDAVGMAIADVDLNGRPDIITANNQSDNISILTVTRDRAYEIGKKTPTQDLEDGGKLEVPKNVTVMIDAGSVFKLRQANIDVGSSEQNLDRSKGAVQVLGTPQASVYFTSYYDNTLGVDNNESNSEAQAGDWGGLVFRNEMDYDMGRTVLETQGIFLNYINHANIRYGGGQVTPDSKYYPIHMIESRPTITFNTITDSTNAAMSADLNSFADTKFAGEDYERIGPEIYGNHIVENSRNGLFIRIKTEAGSVLENLDIFARFDDTDIVHLLSENLIVNGTPGGPTISGSGNYHARTDARLCIDPGIVLKISSARIETEIGAQLIAEGTEELPIVFTSYSDNRYGIGGTFETSPTSVGTEPAPADWSGLYFAPVSNGSIDHAVIAYGGGTSRVEGIWKNFNVVEVHQGNLRLTNSELEFNKGVDTPGGENRFGREGTEASVIYVKGAQPILVNNTIMNNEAPVMSINANSMVDNHKADIGRSTGLIDAFDDYLDNSGPLVRDNYLYNNDLNGMIVRGETLSTASVWDDTDMTHILLDEIVVPNFHTEGGLRLQSDPDESLVIKLYGDNAGFTALGVPTEIDDRIGGTLQVLGMPGYPVVFTSLRDDSVGAGLDPWGRLVLDTDNEDLEPSAGDWRSLKLEEYVNDRNVAVINELELTYGLDAGTNELPAQAQYLGHLASNQKLGEDNLLEVGDDNLRLGYDIYGLIRANETGDPTQADADVYSFIGTPGTEVWFDIDSTTLGLDTIIELIDADGNVHASSVNSAQENLGNIPLGGQALSMDRDIWNINDVYTTSQNDPGMRVILPGSGEARLTYYVRVRGSNATTHGTYQLQIRLQEEQEFSGSTIQKTKIHYATSGIELIGLPTNSPLTVDAVEESGNEGGAKTEVGYNDTYATSQYLGNLLASDKGQLEVAGYISEETDVDWYSFTMDVQGVQSIDGVIYNNVDWPTVFDIDYANMAAGADLTLYVFDELERLIYVGTDSAVVDDQPDPDNHPTADELAGGSFGVKDPFIGPVNLAVGGKGEATKTYYVAVASNMVANALSQDNVRENSISSTMNILGAQTNQAIGIGDNNTIVELDSPTSGLATDILNYTLGDTVMYVTNGTDLFTINPYTGQVVTDVTGWYGSDRLPNVSVTREYHDLAMREDGTLHSILWGRDGGNEGQYREFSTGDGSLVSSQEEGIKVFYIDDNKIKEDDDDGISFEAMAYIPDDLLLAFSFQAGVNLHQGSYIAFGNYNGTKYHGSYDSNLLYIFDEDGNAVQHISVDNELEMVLPTNIAPWGQLLINGETGEGDEVETTDYLYIKPDEAAKLYDNETVTIKHNVWSEPVAGSDEEPEITGTTTTTFEYDLGLTAKLTDGVTEGETFTVGIKEGDTVTYSQTFEFDAGPFIVVTDPTVIPDESHFSLTDNEGNVLTFAFDNNGMYPKSGDYEYIDVSADMTPEEVAEAIADKINEMQTDPDKPFEYKVEAVAEENVVTLLNDSDYSTAGGDLDGVALVGKGVSSGNIAVEIDADYNVAQVLAALQIAVDDHPDGAAELSASTSSNRVAFANMTFGDFSNVANMRHEGDSQDGLADENNIIVEITLNDSKSAVATALTDAINTVTTPETPDPPVDERIRLAAFNDGGEVISVTDAVMGRVTGLTYVDNTLYACDDEGNIFIIENAASEGFNVPTKKQVDKWPNEGGVASISDNYSGGPRAVLVNNYEGYVFSGLTLGPQNAEGGVYSDLIFASGTGIDPVTNLPNDIVLSIDEEGRQIPIFANGHSTLGIQNLPGGSTGLAFSTLDYNLWHGGDSLTFNHDGSYNFPGGAHGSVVTAPFSLVGYSPDDLPVLTFNYNLETDGDFGTPNDSDDPYTSDSTGAVTDTIRVYLSTDGGETWQLRASNTNRTKADRDNAVLLVDGSGVSQQCVLDLSGLVGGAADLSNLRLKFDFSTSGTTGVGDLNGDGILEKSYLTMVGGNKIEDRDILTIQGIDSAKTKNSFEYQLGYSFFLPNSAGQAIEDGDFILVNDVVFEFDKDGSTMPVETYETALEAAAGDGKEVVLQEVIVISLHDTDATYPVAQKITDIINAKFVDVEIEDEDGSFAYVINDRVYLPLATDMQVGSWSTLPGTDISIISPFSSIVPTGEAPDAEPAENVLRVYPWTTAEEVAIMTSEAINDAYRAENYRDPDEYAGFLTTVKQEYNIITFFGGYDVTNKGHHLYTNGLQQGEGDIAGWDEHPMWWDQLHTHMESEDEWAVTGGSTHGVQYYYNVGAQDNQHFGFSVNSIRVGFLERGTKITYATPDAIPDSTFSLGASHPESTGQYHLTIRTGSEYTIGSEGRSFDTNDRHTEGITLLIPDAGNIANNDTFAISDGLNSQTFQFIDGSAGDVEDIPGAVTVSFSNGMSGAEIAKNVCDAINASTNTIISANVISNSGNLKNGSYRVDLFRAERVYGIEHIVFDSDGSGFVEGTASTEVFLEQNFTGDEAEDLIAFDEATQTVQVFRKYGGEGLYRQQILAIGTKVSGLSLKDLNGDGLQDLIAYCPTEHTVATAINSGGGFFTQFDLVSVDDLPGKATLGKFNDDAYLDMAYLSESENLLYVALGNEEGGYDNAVPYATGLAPKDLLTIDLNDDGFDDIVVANSGDDTLMTFLNDGAGNFTFNQDVNTGSLPSSLRLHYITSPLFTHEYLVSYNFGDNSISVFTYNETGTLHGETLDLEDFGLESGSLSSYSFEYLDEINLDSTMMHGDTNAERPQGYVLIDANEILHASEYGIYSDAGTFDSWTHPGAVGTLKNIWYEEQLPFLPGISIQNNLVVDAGNVGIYFSGEPNAAEKTAAIPFGRILNNTIYGCNTGIMVDENASPTILNNIVSNNHIGISVDETSETTVVGAMVYHENDTDYVNVDDQQFSLFLEPGDALFVSPENDNFYLAEGSLAIDNAMDNLEDRYDLANSFSILGYSTSPILAPDYDLYGQLRSDDPYMDAAPGSGLDPYTDRGAIDRVDITAPIASLLDPLDNDPLGVDRDADENEVFIAYERVSTFAIKLSDTDGVGIADYTVVSDAVKIYKDGSDTPLIAGVHYYFSYDSQENIIRLYPVNGTWETGATYEVVLDNGPEGIADIAGNPITLNLKRSDGLTAFNIAIASFDFGDAPDPMYPTLLGDNQDPNEGGARHIQMGGYHLGSHVTGEDDANLQYDEDTGALITDAEGDSGDDGVVFVDSALLIGEETQLIVTASQGDGYLNAWIDFNDDGDWDDEGEHFIANLLLAEGENTITFTVPETVGSAATGFDDVKSAISYARFRYSSAQDLGTGGEAPDGEVEDYQVHIVNALLDYGDAPESYGTTLEDDGAHHELHGTIYLGATVDNEINGRPHPNALGDDQVGTVDGDTVINDEDGVKFLDYLVPGETAQIEVTANGMGYLRAWIDFNGDGMFGENEQIVTSTESLFFNETRVLDIDIPEDAVDGLTYARFRFSSTPTLGPTGLATDGEVEDYAIVISSQPRDFGDAPRSYLTQENSSAATALLVLDGKNNDIHVTANIAGTKYDGVKFVFVNEITYGDDARVTFNEVTRSFLIDVDPNATTAQAVIEAINEEGTFTAMLDVTNDINNNGTGLIGDVTGIVATTSGGYDGVDEEAVSHKLGTNLMLGTLLDAELDGIASDDALADDQGSLDDEDGFGDLSQIQFIAGEQMILNVTATLGGIVDTAYLNGWIDLNQDGVFDESEQVITGLEITEDWVDENVEVAIPISALAGDTYARFRISSQQDLDWFGPAEDGEVEDYKINIIKGDATITGHVFQDSNYNKVWEVNDEPGRAGVMVYVDLDNDGTFNPNGLGIPTEPYTYTMADDPATLGVDETGYYEFKGLFSQVPAYTIRAITPVDTLQSYPNDLVALPDGSYGNADGSYSIFLESKETVSDVDFGYYTKAHIRVDDVVMVEGDLGYTDVEVTLTVTDSFGADLELTYQTQNGSATVADNDYLPSSGNFTFHSQETPIPTWTRNVLGSVDSNDYDYGADGQFVVWEGSDGHDWEIYLFANQYDSDGNPIIHQLTDNETDDHNPTVCAIPNLDGTSTALVAWTGLAEDGTDSEIFLYEGNFTAEGAVDGTPTVQRLTGEENVLEDHAPQVSERFVTWWANDGQSNEIFYYDLLNGTEAQVLTENTYTDKDPIVQGSNIVWIADQGYGNEIFLFTGEYDEYDEPIVTQITDNSANDQNPQIDGDYIVWEGHQSGNGQIYLYQISTGTTTQITSSLSPSLYPQISGSDIVWQGKEDFLGYDWEIYHYNIEAAVPPVNISYDLDATDVRPEIHDGNIVWYSSTATSNEVHYYQVRGDETVVTISDTSESAWYPHITDTLVVWRSHNGTDYDVVIATQEVPEITQTVTFRIVGDTKIEGDESFYVNFAAVDADWVFFDDSQSEIKILNDDGNIDYGDAPASYSTLLVDNGARHLSSSSFTARLGEMIDIENDAHVSADSQGDDSISQDDEDGITFSTALVQGSDALISVNISDPGGNGGPYYLDAWIDFDGDGTWNGPNEKLVFDDPNYISGLGSVSLQNLDGINTLKFHVPENAVADFTHARFRLSSTGGLNYTGQVTGGEVEDYQVKILAKPEVEDKTIHLFGTGGDDTFIFTAGSELTVNLNGADYTYDPEEVDEIIFDGGAGHDTVVFNGSYATETVELWTNKGDFTGNGYMVSTSNVESLTAVAGSENDTVTMHGSSGNDLFESLPDSGFAALTGTGFELMADSFSNIEAYGEGGNDQAKLYGSSDYDTFTASPESAQMESLGISTVNVYDFRYLYGYAVSGDNNDVDVAYLSDLGQDQDDMFTFTVSPDDLESLQGQDSHVPTILSMATMVNNGGLSLSAYSFSYVYASSTGGSDEANLYGSPAADNFIGKPIFDPNTGSSKGSYARLMGTYEDFTYRCTVTEFGRVSAAAKESSSSPSQNDTATLEDSPGSDTFTGTPTYSKMVGDGFYYRADNFQEINANSKNGGEDVAVLYDSTGDDVFVGSHALTQLLGSSFSIGAINFKHLNAYAKFGGHDTAILSGSEGDDTYLTTPDYGKMTRSELDGSQSYYRAYYFSEVTADGVAGHDTAYLLDSKYADLLVAKWNTENPADIYSYASISNDNYDDFNYIIKDFDEITATSTSAGDKKDVEETVDFLFTEGIWDDLND